MSIVSFITYLLLPPTGLALLALAALGLPRQLRPRLLAAGLLAVLVALSMPVAAVPLLWSLRVEEGAVAEPPEAIVVLSAEVERTAGGGVDVGALTLERERAGVALHKLTGLPMLVTGGVVGGSVPIALLMARSLVTDFGVPPRWVEPRSATTWENAVFSAALLKEAGVRRVFVVTHAWHMRRSLLAFRRAGLEAVPAPVRSLARPTFRVGDFVPNVGSLVRSYWAVHEWVGLAAYAWR